MINEKIVNQVTILKNLYRKRKEYLKLLKKDYKATIDDMFIHKHGVVLYGKSDSDTCDFVYITSPHRRRFSATYCIVQTSGNGYLLITKIDSIVTSIKYLNSNGTHEIEYDKGSVFNASVHHGLTLTFDDIDYILKNIKDINHSIKIMVDI